MCVCNYNNYTNYGRLQQINHTKIILVNDLKVKKYPKKKRSSGSNDAHNVQAETCVCCGRTGNSKKIVISRTKLVTIAEVKDT